MTYIHIWFYASIAAVLFILVIGLLCLNRTIREEFIRDWNRK